MQLRRTRGDRRQRRARGARLRAPLDSNPSNEQLEATHGTVISSQTPTGREDELSQDQATYNCSCGFVFQAPVSTSVSCPHCGSEQAW